LDKLHQTRNLDLSCWVLISEQKRIRKLGIGWNGTLVVFV
jgi:hypothetical protein